MEHKKTVRIIISVLLAAAVIVFLITTITAADEPSGSTPEDIIGFLSENGYTVSSPVTKEITIPEEFSDVYENYNKLQKKQNFNLEKYKGRSAVSYTFSIIGYINESGEPENNVEAHIIVCDGRIIGGDIASTRLNGFMKPIRE